MDERGSSAQFFSGDRSDAVAWLRGHGVDKVRVEICDLAGVARGKAVSIDHFEHVLGHGVPFCAALFAFDIEATVLPGTNYGETIGYGDFIGKPDLASLRLLRHQPNTALVIGDIHWPDGRPVEASPRGVLGRIVDELEALGYRALAAPELEFYILDQDYRLMGDGVQAYSMHRRNKFLAEEEALLDAVAAHGGFEFSGHEYGPGQYEVTIPYQDIRAMADFGHLFRTTMKEAAWTMNRRVTFMAKPFDGMTGNSCHMHLSLIDRAGANVFAAPDAPHRISETCRHFMGGVLAHLEELTAIYFPNANSYRRMVPGQFAPFSRAWAIDNRTAAIRILNETVAGTRTELRFCGGDINLYLAFAAYLAAGIDGIRNKIDPGPPGQGDLDEQDLERLPNDWGKALDAFDASDWVKQIFGADFCKSFSVIKRHEYDSFRRTVPDNERKLYIEWL